MHYYLASLMASAGLLSGSAMAMPQHARPRAPPHTLNFKIHGSDEVVNSGALIADKVSTNTPGDAHSLEDTHIFALPPGGPHNMPSNPPPAHVPFHPVCTPRDTVKNPSFEWLTYPFEHWNLTDNNDVFVVPFTGYPVDGNGLISIFGVSPSGSAATAVTWHPTATGPYDDQEVIFSQMVEVCPGHDYQFSVGAVALDYTYSPGSYIELKLGSDEDVDPDETRTYWDPLLGDLFTDIYSNTYTVKDDENYIPLQITLHADSDAFGPSFDGTQWTYQNNIKIQIDVVKLIPQDEDEE